MSGITGIVGILEFFIPTKVAGIIAILGITGICGILEFLFQQRVTE